MSKKSVRFDMGLISQELYQAMRQVSEAESVSMAHLARQALKDAFLVEEPEQEFRVIAISEADFKRLGIPVIGRVVDDETLGNRVEMLEEAA